MRARQTAAAGLLAALLLSGCTPEDDADPSPSPSESASASQGADEDWTPDSLAAAILDGDRAGDLSTAEPVASASGVVTLPGGAWEVEVDVLSVVADEAGTDLAYLVRSPGGTVVEIDRFAWGDGRGVWDDTRAVALVDPRTGERLLPYTAPEQAGTGGDTFCACSTMPSTLGEGHVLGALLPPLSAGVETVTLELPGLAPITDVPVVWR